MPDFTYYDDYNTDTGNWAVSTYYTASQAQQEQGVNLIQQLWEEHQQRMDEQNRREEELRADKVNYPLFFWKDKK